MQNEDAHKVVMDVDDQLNRLSNYGDDVDLLNDLQKVALYVGNLEREINNGGFSQFYWNSSGGIRRRNPWLAFKKLEP